MSCKRNSSLRARIRTGVVTLVWLAVSFPAEAFEIKVWPLLDLERSVTETRLRLLGPLVEWRRTPEETAFTLRPLLHTTRRRADSRTRGSALYPVASWESGPDSFFVRFFGLISYEHVRRDGRADDSWTSELTAFPLVFYRESPERDRSLSVLPFYADVSDFFGYERLQMLLFPLYLRLVQPLHERTWLPFPFVSWIGGRLGEGFRIWPIYGRTVLGERSETRYVAWPLYVRKVDHPSSARRTTTRISWPLFSTIDGPKLESRSYGYLPLVVLPAYTRTVDHENRTESRGFPWPFWTEQRSTETGERLSLRLTPFYQDRRTPTLRSVFYLWPFYRSRSGLGDDAAYQRTDVLFFLYRDQHEGEGEKRRHTQVVFPLRISRTDRDGTRLQALTLLDGLFPSNEILDTLYSPLVRIYGSRTAGESTRREILWGMWEWGAGPTRPPLSLSRK